MMRQTEVMSPNSSIGRPGKQQTMMMQKGQSAGPSKQPPFGMTRQPVNQQKAPGNRTSVSLANNANGMLPVGS